MANQDLTVIINHIGCTTVQCYKCELDSILPQAPQSTAISHNRRKKLTAFIISQTSVSRQSIMHSYWQPKVAQWRSGRALDLRSLGRGFDSHRAKDRLCEMAVDYNMKWQSETEKFSCCENYQTTTVGSYCHQKTTALDSRHGMRGRPQQSQTILDSEWIEPQEIIWSDMVRICCITQLWDVTMTDISQDDTQTMTEMGS